MSENKLYAIKKDGMYLDADVYGSRSWSNSLGSWSDLYKDKEAAESLADDIGGTVVTLSESHSIVVPKWFDKWVRSFNDLDEEDKKAVVASKILQHGYGFSCNAPVFNGNIQYGDHSANTEQELYISDHKQELVIAVMTGNYTVKKEKKYWVKLDGFVTTDGQQQYLSKKFGHWFASRKDNRLKQRFTRDELNAVPDWVRGLVNKETLLK